MSIARRSTAQRRLQRMRGWLVPWALALLVAAQALALVHGLVHHDHAVHDARGDHAHNSLLEDLFSHTSDTDCRLFDQHAPTDLASVPVLAVRFDLTAPAQAGEAPAAPLSARLRAFRARDPPTLA